MKRLFLFILICLAVLLSFSACGAKDSQETDTSDGAYTAVKDEGGNITGYERKYHNDKGDITRWDVYDAAEQYDHYILYEYDSNNRLAKETYYHANGIAVYYNAYSYTEDGVIAEKDYANAKEGSQRILYKDGKENERLTYDINDKLIKYELYQNDTWVEAALPTES